MIGYFSATPRLLVLLSLSSTASWSVEYLMLLVTDDDPSLVAIDNLPPEVTTEDHDLYKQVREKALQV